MTERPRNLLTIDNSQQPTGPYTEFRTKYVQELSSTLGRVDLQAFSQAVDLFAQTSGTSQIFTAGNGGSAAIAEHFAHNLNWDTSGRLPKDKKLSARCLNAEGAEVTARANDRSYAYVFATQLENHARPGDVFVAISASGDSDSIVTALKEANKLDIPSIFIGQPDSKASSLASLSILIDSPDQQVVEDATQSVTHMLVRALQVKLEGLDEQDLLNDLAHLRAKAAGVRELSKKFGPPTEVQSLIRDDFERALAKLACVRIKMATRNVFELAEDTPVELGTLAPDFTSYLRTVDIDGQKVVAKTGFGKTKARLMQDYADDGASGMVDVFLRSDPSVEHEFRRNEFLFLLFPTLIPRPYGLNEGVAFYENIPGQTLNQAILEKKATIPFENLGKTLRTWHTKMSKTEVPENVQSHCEGKLDRINRYQSRYSTPLGIIEEFNPLFVNGYIDISERITTMGKIDDAIIHLNESNVLTLPRDTWGHGDFKPENVLLTDTGKFFFIDNDLHQKPAIVDVAKMVSRLTALCFNQQVKPESIKENISQFLTGYYGSEPIPYQQISDIIAMDLLAILGSYNTIPKKELSEYPTMAQVFMRDPEKVIDYIKFLTTNEHTSIDTFTNFFVSQPNNI